MHKFCVSMYINFLSIRTQICVSMYTNLYMTCLLQFSQKFLVVSLWNIHEPKCKPYYIYIYIYIYVYMHKYRSIRADIHFYEGFSCLSHADVLLFVQKKWNFFYSRVVRIAVATKSHYAVALQPFLFGAEKCTISLVLPDVPLGLRWDAGWKRVGIGCPFSFVICYYNK
jgi:hypothetical protein